MSEGKIEYEYIVKYEGETVRDDPNLTPEEKETFMLVVEEGNENKVKVESDKRAIVAGLLRHDHAKIIQLRKYGGVVVGGSFELPVGCLKIQKNKRKNDNLSLVVSS